MTTTTRTIDQVLQLRLRAAELRVLERTTAIVKAHAAIEQAFIAGEREQEELAKAIEARQLAVEALTLVRREIDARQGKAEPVVYDPDTVFATRRYAAVLMFDHPELSAAEALAQAHQDEHLRFETYCPAEDDDLDDEEDAD